MAGDWLKMELNTPDKPEVWSIASDLNIDPDAVVGKLFRLWSWFDQHSEKGNAPSVSKMLLDRLVSVPNFCDSVIKAGWMTEKDSVLSLPNFDRHNGKTGKSRSLTAKRVAKHKALTPSDEKSNGDSVSEALAREEKRRIEKNKEDKDKKQKQEKINFSVFWEAYPKGDRKSDSEKKWKSLSLDSQEKALADCKTRYLEIEKKYIPAAVVYLNGKRWDDDPLPKYSNDNKSDKHSGFADRDYSAGATPLEDITWNH